MWCHCTRYCFFMCYAVLCCVVVCFVLPPGALRLPFCLLPLVKVLVITVVSGLQHHPLLLLRLLWLFHHPSVRMRTTPLHRVWGLRSWMSCTA